MIPEPPWRVAIATRVLPVALGFHATLREAGHEPVALLTIRDSDGRYGDFELGPMLQALPPDLDVLLPASRGSIAPLLEGCRADLVFCMGFRWKIPAEALALPPLGWLNGHPSLLPHHRGPVPVAWAIRAGEEEIGITFHRMDAELDTGPVLAQRPIALDGYVEPEELYGRLGPEVLGVLGEALEKLAAGERGTIQEGGDYQSFFSDDDAWLDWSGSAPELHRLVWAWRYALSRGVIRGALAELDGQTVRVLASSLTEVEGARCVECADAPLWLVRTEPVSETEAARRASAPAPATH